MPWKGESIGQFYGRARERSRPLGYDIVQDLSGYATKRTKANTPVADTWTKTKGRAPGTMRELIMQSPTKRIGSFVRGGVETEDPKAPYVELGTGLFGPRHSKYPIIPHSARALAFRVRVDHRLFNDQNVGKVMAGKMSVKKIFGPGTVLVARVMHPGSPGQHMFLKGIQETEMAQSRIVDKRMNEWARGLRSVAR